MLESEGDTRTGSCNRLNDFWAGAVLVKNLV